MAKSNALCPICNTRCIDCSIYRGRHYSLRFCARYRAHHGRNNGNRVGSLPDPQDVFKQLMEAPEPWAESSRELKYGQIKITVNDLELDTYRDIDISEAKDWDWDNPLTIRMIDGRHVTSWDMLVQICNYKHENGAETIELDEGPRFMLLGGG